MMTVIVCALAGAVLFRVRGGLLDLWHIDIGTVRGRIAWSSLGVLVALLAVDWRLVGLCPLLLAGTFMGWPRSIDMGRNEGEWQVDFYAHMGRGIFFTLPCAPLLWLVTGNDWFGYVGLLAGPLYELGWRTPSKIPGFLRGAEMGEAYFGAAIGAALAVAVP
jgi:hypothetical protein